MSNIFTGTAHHKPLHVELNEAPSLEFDFPIEEYAIYSRVAIGKIYPDMQGDAAKNIVVGKNLLTEELICVPPHLGECRVRRSINFNRKDDHVNHPTFCEIMKQAMENING